MTMMTDFQTDLLDRLEGTARGVFAGTGRPLSILHQPEYGNRGRVIVKSGGRTVGVANYDTQTPPWVWASNPPDYDDIEDTTPDFVPGD